MTPDLLEERLRSALHDATSAEEGAWLDLDPSAVLGRGRRAVLRRRMAAGASLAAATLVVGLAGWGALGGGAERATSPAGQSPSVSATGTATANLKDIPVIPQEGGTGTQGENLRVTVDRATGVVTYSTVRNEVAQRITEGRLPLNPRGASWATVPSSGLVVGVMPEAATDQVFVWAGDVPGASHTTVALPGTRFKAFAVWHSGNTDETTFAGLDWTDGEAVYRSDGARVTSALDGELVAFADEKQGIFGLFGDGSSATKSLGDTGTGERPYLMMGNQLDGADTLVNAVLVILPAGAREVTPTATPGATVTTWSSLVDGAINPTLAVVRIDVPLDVGGTGLGSIRWTESDGQTSTFVVPR